MFGRKKKDKINRWKVTIQKQSRTFKSEDSAREWANKLGKTDINYIDVKGVFVEDEDFP
jgi:hypothetical protein